MNHSRVLRTDVIHSRFASFDEFQSVFVREAPNLFRLAYLLTADWNLAVTSLLCALDDCLTATAVTWEWAITWTRRAVIRSSLRMLREREDASIRGADVTFLGMENNDSDEDLIQGLHQVLSLPEFERLVYILSVLEGYSKLETALLLRRAPIEVIEARTQAIQQVSLFCVDNEEKVGRSLSPSELVDPRPW
jgi:hypothetical protein